MKCDETKPSCKRCILAGRKCVGVYYSDQPVPIEPSRASTQTTMGDADKKRELQSGFNIRDVYNPTPDGIALQLVTKRLLPPDWHFLEVLSFCKLGLASMSDRTGRPYSYFHIFFSPDKVLTDINLYM